jgi:inorganic pyrophosphatase
MNLDKVGPGRSVPNDINVIIEIPTQSHPVKYEVDKETGAMFVDRFLSTAMYYPAIMAIFRRHCLMTVIRLMY